ncbi:hypothetical protein EDB84DRAFT_1446396 [Lactarius hengduanensis]|nr:hypothetical protein EDB84DRAFT_1446396 [Lactarius hengduanensis]
MVTARAAQLGWWRQQLGRQLGWRQGGGGHWRGEGILRRVAMAGAVVAGGTAAKEEKQLSFSQVVAGGNACAAGVDARALSLASEFTLLAVSSSTLHFCAHSRFPTLSVRALLRLPVLSVALARTLSRTCPRSQSCSLAPSRTLLHSQSCSLAPSRTLPHSQLRSLAPSRTLPRSQLRSPTLSAALAHALSRACLCSQPRLPVLSAALARAFARSATLCPRSAHALPVLCRALPALCRAF